MNSLTAAALSSVLPPGARVAVAFSGGLDSSVLTHLLAQVPPLRGDLTCRAIHINHGISSHADGWAQHCRQCCVAWRLPLEVVELQVSAAAGESLEAVARDARYHALSALLQPGEWLLTAHHADDQAETFLLQALRGGGVHGLAGMPARRPLGGGWLVRPLLAFTREQLRAYAESWQLTWVEDDSNTRLDYDRNFLRLRVLPPLRERWPGLAEVLSRVTRHQAEARQLLDEVAVADARPCVSEQRWQLALPPLLALSPERRKNVLRYWLASLQVAPPNSHKLEEFLRQLASCAVDSRPAMQWRAWSLRRYQQHLYLAPLQPAHDASRVVPWDLATPLFLPGVGSLRAEPGAGGGLDPERCRGRRVEVRFRQGGEDCRPAGRRGRRSLKKLLQESTVPPWSRDRLPLVYVEDTLAAVAGLCYCQPYATATPAAPGVKIVFHPLSEGYDHC